MWPGVRMLPEGWTELPAERAAITSEGESW
jgi:hypothetical protein